MNESVRVAVVSVLVWGIGCAELVTVPAGSPYPAPNSQPELGAPIEHFGPPQIARNIEGETLIVSVFREATCSETETQRMVQEFETVQTPASKWRNLVMGISSIAAMGAGAALAATHCPKVTGLGNDGTFYDDQCLPQDKEAQTGYNVTGYALIGVGAGVGAWALYNALKGGKEEVKSAAPRESQLQPQACGTRPLANVPLAVEIANRERRVETDKNGNARVPIFDGGSVSKIYLRNPAVRIRAEVEGSSFEDEFIVHDATIIERWTADAELAEDERNRRQAERYVVAIREMRQLLRTCIPPWDAQRARCLEPLAEAVDKVRAQPQDEVLEKLSNTEREEVVRGVQELVAWRAAHEAGVVAYGEQVKEEAARRFMAMARWSAQAGSSEDSTGLSSSSSSARVTDEALRWERREATAAERAAPANRSQAAADARGRCTETCRRKYEQDKHQCFETECCPGRTAAECNHKEVERCTAKKWECASEAERRERSCRQGC